MIKDNPNLQIIPSFFLFTILFYSSLHLFRKYWKKFRNLNTNLQIQFISRVISCINALIVTLAATYVLLTDDNIYNHKLM